MIEVLFVIGMILLFIALPLMIYTFLVFPNFDGVAHNIHWYTYDENSQHYLYWFGFWMIVLFGAKSASGSIKSKEKQTIIKERSFSE